MPQSIFYYNWLLNKKRTLLCELATLTIAFFFSFTKSPFAINRIGINFSTKHFYLIKFPLSIPTAQGKQYLSNAEKSTVNISINPLIRDPSGVVYPFKIPSYFKANCLDWSRFESEIEFIRIEA